MRWGLAVVFALLLPVALAVMLLHGKPQGLTFKLVSYDDLPGWSHGLSDGDSLKALLKSCEKIESLPPDMALPGASIGGQYRDWLPACNALESARVSTLKATIEAYFLPLSVTVGGKKHGVFTGYHEAYLRGSPVHTDRYWVPLYARPPELVSVDLGAFRATLAGERIAGRVENGRLVPFASRSSIMDGALDDRRLEVLWVDSPVDAYFLQVQGSGRVQLPDGSFMGVGYAAQNGYPNRLIGRYLIETGAIKRENMSAQAIRQWLLDNPDKVADVLKTDPSYVFFRPLENGDGPFGSANVALTPGHSLAVDRRFLPLHAPMWLATTYPEPEAAGTATPLRRLMVAQDTGGAIGGEIRGDVFWGFGDRAEEIAGKMVSNGQYWLLLPRDLAIKAAGDEF